MQTCVYMSNRKIQVAVGNPKNHSIAVKRLYETEAPEVEDINQFIDRLEERDIFEQLDYTGYVWSEERGMWTINLVCYLSENAGK